MIEWVCIGGPLHGYWKPAGRTVVVAPTLEPVDYNIRQAVIDAVNQPYVRVNVAQPPRPVLYYPTWLNLSGWTVKFKAYVEAGHINGVPIPRGTIMPGGIVGMPMAGIAEPVCRWCYGRPMNGFNACSRVSCIQNVAWLDSLERATADDAKGWHGDQS